MNDVHGKAWSGGATEADYAYAYMLWEIAKLLERYYYSAITHLATFVSSRPAKLLSPPWFSSNSNRGPFLRARLPAPCSTKCVNGLDARL